MANPLELSHACRQSLQRTAAALGEPGAPLPASHTAATASLLSAAGHLAELAHSSAAAPGACVTPLGPWCGQHVAEALQFLNTAPLLPTSTTGEASTAAAAAAQLQGAAPPPPPREQPPAGPLEASRFDTALERSIHAFAAGATAVMRQRY